MEETKKTTHPAPEGKPKSNRKPASVVIAELKQELADQKADYEARIAKKQREGNIIADECDAKLANKDLIIRGLQGNLAARNRELEANKEAVRTLRAEVLDLKEKLAAANSKKGFLGLFKRSR